MAPAVVKTLLICHDDSPLHHDGIARWLTSFSQLTGILILHEERRSLWRRAKRELRRVGTFRFADALAFRLFYKLFLASADSAWEQRTLERMREVYPPVDDRTFVMRATSPNSAEAEQFIRRSAPDIVLALCKTILKPRVFSIPRHGTFVLHPGICPEYRNAHGCFWALANDDVRKVGMSLLRIDEGIDTGPIYGHFTYPYDELLESHVRIQHRVVVENLDGVRDRLTAICDDLATPIDTAGRASATWGQPWLTSYVKWKHNAKRRRIGDSPRAALS
jgi:hypothetical protein